MRELRFHGRGGQGAVIASKVLATALFREMDIRFWLEKGQAELNALR